MSPPGRLGGVSHAPALSSGARPGPRTRCAPSTRRARPGRPVHQEQEPRDPDRAGALRRRASPACSSRSSTWTPAPSSPTRRSPAGPQGDLHRPDLLFAAARAGGPAGRAGPGVPAGRLPRRGRAGPARPAHPVRQRRAGGARQRAAGRPARHQRDRPRRAARRHGDHRARPRDPPGGPAAHRRAGARRSAGASRSTTSAPTCCRWPSCRCCAPTSSSSTCAWCRSAPGRRSPRS